MGKAEPQKIWYLHKINLFQGIPDADYLIIDRHSREKVFQRGEIIYLPGAPASAVYMIKRGKVKISRITEGGKEFTIALLKEGDIFGEMAVAGEEEREEQAMAMEETYLCIMPRDDFQRLLQEKPYLSLKFIKLVGLRRKILEIRLKDLLFKSAPSRLARLLLFLAEEYGHAPSEGTWLAMRLSHQEIANMTGLARETASTFLSEWKKEGWIDYTPRQIVIKSPKNLQMLTEEP